MTVPTVYVDQSARLYQDVVDALGELDPPEELAGPQAAYLEAWRGQLNLAVSVRDAGFTGATAILEALQPAFGNAAAETPSQATSSSPAVAATGSDVDLICDGRPA